MTRDRDQTRARILESVGRLLAEQGFASLGIRAVARAAGVDKVLIYRYFGGLPGLLEAYGRESDFWPPVSELVPPELEDLAPAERAKRMLRLLGEALERRPVTLEILRWELQERNELTDALARVREEPAGALLQGLEAPPHVDAAAIATVLTMAQIYLALRTGTVDVFNGIPLDTPEGRTRLSRAMDLLIDLAFDSPDGPSPRREED